MRIRSLRWLVAALAAGLVGCASPRPPLYHWGNYEAVLLEMYREDANAPPADQIAKLTATIDEALAQDRKVAPGIYAHLGAVLAAEGQNGPALQALRDEKAHFPESAVFIDGLIERSGLEENSP